VSNNNEQPSRAGGVTGRDAILLRESLELLAPLVRALVRNGVTYPQLAQALKRTFVDAARAELSAERKRATDSAVSLLSGVHRKDVRLLGSHRGPTPKNQRILSLASEVATRWISDPAYLDRAGAPRALPLRSRDPSEATFERLVQSISKDFHVRSVLEELLRLGVADLDIDLVRLRDEAFVPSAGFAEAAYFWAANVRDHLAAGERNLRYLAAGQRPPHIEHAVLADKLSSESVDQLQQLARRLWVAAYKKVVTAARACVERDRVRAPRERSMRMRFGSFFYYERAPVHEEATEPRAETERRDRPAPGYPNTRPATLSHSS
jgi:hypothetical protein